MKNNHLERSITMEAFHEVTRRIVCAKGNRNAYPCLGSSVAQKTYCEHGPYIILVEVPNNDVYRRDN